MPTATLRAFESHMWLWCWTLFKSFVLLNILSLCLAEHHLWSLFPVPARCDEACLQLLLIVIAKFPHNGCCSFHQGRRFHLNTKEDIEILQPQTKLNSSAFLATEMNRPVKRQLEFGHFGNRLCICQWSSYAAEYFIMHLDQLVDGFGRHIRPVDIVVTRAVIVCNRTMNTLLENTHSPIEALESDPMITPPLNVTARMVV